MADFSKVYGAGLRNGYVRTADGVLHDIDAIINVEGDPQSDETQIKGDDTIKATFSSGAREDITVTANGLTIDVIQAITSDTASSSAGGAHVPLGTQASLNPPFVEVGGEINGRTAAGDAVIVKKVWYKVQFKPAKITAGNGNELSVELNGTAYQTDKDVTGATLTPAAVADVSIRSGQL